MLIFSFIFLSFSFLLSFKNHRRQQDGLSVWMCHICPWLIKLYAFWCLFIQSGLDCLFVLDSFDELVDEFVIFLFDLHFKQFSVGEDAALVHDFELFFCLNEVLWLFEILVLAMADLVKPFYHPIIFPAVFELSFFLHFVKEEFFPWALLLFCP